MYTIHRFRASRPRFPRSRPQWLHGVIFAVTVIIIALLDPASAQFGPSSEVADSSSPSPKKLEDTVVTDMLRIVDNKFDTLTTRITSLERAVSNLQFFSIRQFRQIGGSLQDVSAGVKTVSAQVGKLEVDGRGLKITSSLLHREVTEMKSMTSELSEELVSSRAFISSTIDKQSTFIKAVVSDSLLKVSQDSKTDMKESLNTLLAQYRQEGEAEKHPVNCSVDFSPLYEHVDKRFSYLKRDVYNSVANLVKAEKAETTTQCENVLKRYQEEIRRQPRRGEGASVVDSIDGDQVLEKNRSAKAAALSKRERLNLKKNAKQSTTADVPPRGVIDIVKGNFPTLSIKSERSPLPSRNDSKNTPDQAWQNEMDAMVMEALINMTTSVQQAVSYFRNTAHLLERIVSNTDMLLEAQNSPESRARALPVNTGRRIRYQTGPVSDGPGGFNVRSALPRSRIGRVPVGMLPGQPLGVPPCGLPEDVVGSIATIVKNGSQLLEILTDLAQVSSMSLTKATSTLQSQISGVEAIQDRMESVLLSALETASGFGRDGLAKLSNSTDKMFKLVEAIAANTGWLPFIFNNVKHQDAVGNRTLNFVSKNHGMLRHLVYADRHQQQQARAEEDNSSGGRLSGSSSREVTSRGRRGEGSSKEEFTLDERSMETIYSTSVQLHRIMPALTKLLAEPDPLFTLVDGGRPDQGRVEIYHKGQWGALCHDVLSHAEADIICRHLRFQGGISAGAGHFGAGAGVTWSVNTTCLKKAKCAAVEHVTTSPPCSHDRDAAVICDHMLRIEIIEEVNPESDGTIGRLEMHHRGMWLPICGDGWSGYSARVACKQMGYNDGREKLLDEWLPGRNATWLARVMCNGTETRLDACPTNGWTRSCEGLKPAGVLCL